MFWVNNIYVITLIEIIIFNIIVLFLLNVLGIFKKKSQKISSSLILIGCLIWVLGNILELGFVNFQTKIYMSYIQHLGREIVIVSWFIFFIYFIGYKKWLSKRNIAIVTAIPSIMLLLVFTNEYHHLIFKNYSLVTYRIAPVLIENIGPLYWLDIAFSFLLVIFITSLIIRTLIKSYYAYRWQFYTFLAIHIVILLVIAADISRINIFPHFEKIPIAVVISMTLLILVLSRSKTSEIVPIARSIVFDSISDGVLVLDANDNILDSNRFMKKLMNLPLIKINGKPLKKLMPDLDSLIEKFNIDKQSGISYKIKNKFFDINISNLTNPRRIKIGKVVVLRDITIRKKNEDKIKYLSFHDSLTQLFNRAFFEEELKRLNVKRRLPLSIVLLDIDGLRKINENYGYKNGDNSLIRLSKILNECFRKEDIIARIGGDTFGIILPSTTIESTSNIIKRLKKACKKNDGHKINFSISIGSSTKNTVSQNINEIIREADSNMNKHKLLEKKSIHGSIVSSLERALLERDYETEEHVARMKKYSLVLGRELELADNELDDLKLLATLHDIGKISIPDNIIFKPGKLNVTEWKIVKKHPEIGYRIAKTTPELSTIAEGILTHHEWWNGKGYPRGLKNVGISIISRIISIIDAYDAMTSDRPYRKALSKEEAISELDKFSGMQFDPDLVKTFTALIKNNRLDYKTYTA